MGSESKVIVKKNKDQACWRNNFDTIATVGLLSCFMERKILDVEII